MTDQNPSCSDVPVAKSTNDCVSITSKKLLNTSFEKLDISKSILTRQQAKEVGIRSPANVEIASGFKLQDAVLYQPQQFVVHAAKHRQNWNFTKEIMKEKACVSLYF